MAAKNEKKTRDDYRAELPVPMREHFDNLCEDYRFAALEVHGHAFVSYAVLANLVRAGWRRSAVDQS